MRSWGPRGGEHWVCGGLCKAGALGDARGLHFVGLAQTAHL